MVQSLKPVKDLGLWTSGGRSKRATLCVSSPWRLAAEKISQILCIFLTNCARSQGMWVGRICEKVGVDWSGLEWMVSR
jgi:hypothetical protein